MAPCKYTPGKRRFASKEAAQLWADRYRAVRGWDRWPYYCDPYSGGCGWHHLTSTHPDDQHQPMYRRAEE